MSSMQAYEGEYKADKCEIYNHQSKEKIKENLIKIGCRLKEGWNLRQLKAGDKFLSSPMGRRYLVAASDDENWYRLIVEEGPWIEPEEPEDPWQFDGYRPFFNSEVQELLQQHQKLTKETVCYTFFGDGSGSIHIGWGTAKICFGTKEREHETQRLERIKKFLEERRRDMKND